MICFDNKAAQCTVICLSFLFLNTTFKYIHKGTSMKKKFAVSYINIKSVSTNEKLGFTYFVLKIENIAHYLLIPFL